MRNFEYQTPTKLFFGDGVIVKLPEVLANLGRKVLLTYGGGSIKKIGLYDKIKELLKDFNLFELSGIEPNPKYNPSVLEGIKICKENNIDVILSVGGGSVLDCSKAIAGGAKYEGSDPWNLISNKVPTKAALPVVSIVTLAATGSEYGSGAVISRTETNDKLCYMNPYLYPVCTFLDPKYTFTVSKRQTAAGSIDAMSHVMEQYFAEDTTLLNDGFCEAELRSIMANAKKALANPSDYTARAELMYCCTLGCNGILSLGNSASGWACHAIEHALSGYFDITHGEGLAVITPRWMKHILCDRTLNRFVKYGINVFDIDKNLAPYEIANLAIQKTYEFFESVGISMHLKDLGVKADKIDEMAHHVAVNEGLENAYYPLFEKDIKEIISASM